MRHLVGANKTFKIKIKKEEEDERTVIDKFIDKYWLENVTRPEQAAGKQFSIKEIDKKVHELIHHLLSRSEVEKWHLYQLNLNYTMQRHQELIDIIKDQIKPGLFKEHTRKFTPSMIKKYFNKLYQSNIDENMQKI